MLIFKNDSLHNSDIASQHYVLLSVRIECFDCCDVVFELNFRRLRYYLSVYETEVFMDRARIFTLGFVGRHHQVLGHLQHHAHSKPQAASTRCAHRSSWICSRHCWNPGLRLRRQVVDDVSWCVYQ